VRGAYMAPILWAPMAPSPGLPLVTIVIPCRDEERHVEGCVRSAMAQDWPRDRLEILVADGMSMDATREILARLAGEDARIHLLDNTARIPASGLNECIRRARGDFIVRMDVHAEYAPDFVRNCVGVLDRTGADNVGGPAKPRARTFFQRCVAAALGSPLGIGGSRHPAGYAEGWVESVWPGAFRRDVFERVGLFDPNALSNEDLELDRRIAAAGGRAYSSPEIGLHYFPRESMRALARQYFRYGQGRARTLLKHGRSASWGPAMPFFWLLGEAALFATSRWQPLAPWSLAAYALATGAEAVRVGRQEGPLAVPVVWAIFPIVHVAQGAGFATGLVRYVLRPDWSAGERLPPNEAAVHSSHATASR